ncbi:MAG: thrombospondin type 3 repeat-containing protein [bacterium]
MTLARMGHVALALVLMIPVPVAAQDYLPAGDVVQDRIFEVHPVAGWFSPDKNSGYSGGAPYFGLRGTLNNSAWWALELQVAMSPGQTHRIRRGMLESYNAELVYDNAGRPVGFVVTDMQRTESVQDVSSNLLTTGGTMTFDLSKQQLRPFLAIGGGFINDIGTGGDEPGAFSNIYYDLGGGVKYYKPSGWGVRLDIHDVTTRKDDVPRLLPDAPLIAAEYDLFSGGGKDGVLFQEPYSPVEYRGKRWLHNVGVSVSLTVPFGYAWKDGDGDGVATRFDKCPTTAPGVVVDATGCGIDTDGDGVYDGIDKCPNTPKGATVDHLGCPADADSDGVYDGIDKCPDTPRGATVDATGCPHDTDGDGILDGLDKCNDTPKGAAIDENGCSTDPVEDQLLRGDASEVPARFEPGAPDLDPRSYHAINKFAQVLERLTSSPTRPRQIEVSVDAERPGADAMRLAQQRAETVRKYLVDRFPGILADNLIARGHAVDVEAATHVNVRVAGEGVHAAPPPPPPAPSTPPTPETPPPPPPTPEAPK